MGWAARSGDGSFLGAGRADCGKRSGQGKNGYVCCDAGKPGVGSGGCQRTWCGVEGVLVRGKWKGKVGVVGVEECEPGPKGWEGHTGVGSGSVDKWRGR